MMPEMRILVCASEAPLPPRNGLRLQLAELTGALARRHEVTVLAFRWPGQEGAPPAGVELIPIAPTPDGWRRRAGWVRAALRREPLETTRLTAPMSAAVAQVIANRGFDVAHVSPGLLAGIAPALDGLPAIIAPLDAWPLNVQAQVAAARGPRRVALAAHLRLVSRYVAQAYRPYGRVVLVSEEDAEAARRADPDIATAVVPNGVDSERFNPGAERREPGLVVFSGALGAPSNVLAAERLARRVVPQVRTERPDVRLALVGRAPTPEVRVLDRFPGVEVVGEVPDLRPWLRRAQVYACPIETGTGIKNKLLEAMACGAPAVATALACRGLSVRAESELLLADDDSTFADGVLRLLTDARLRSRLASAARAYVAQHHDWTAVAERFEALYTAVGADDAG